MELGRPNLEVFADTLLALGQANQNLTSRDGRFAWLGKAGAFWTKTP